MRTSVALLLIVFYSLGLGFFLYPKNADSDSLVSKNANSDSLVSLSDDDMMKLLGGKKRAQKKSDWKGKFARCNVSVSACRGVVARDVTYPQYRCVDCSSGFIAFTYTRVTKKVSSYCVVKYKNSDGSPYCSNKADRRSSMKSCVKWNGNCPLDLSDPAYDDPHAG